jgi:predicted small lipoprotein YifL
MEFILRIAGLALLVVFSLIIFACGKKGPPTLNDYQPKTKLPVSTTEKKQAWTADNANLQWVVSFILTESIGQKRVDIYVLRSNT